MTLQSIILDKIAKEYKWDNWKEIKSLCHFESDENVFEWIERSVFLAIKETRQDYIKEIDCLLAITKPYEKCGLAKTSSNETTTKCAECVLEKLRLRLEKKGVEKIHGVRLD